MNNLAPDAQPEPLPDWEETLADISRFDRDYWDDYGTDGE